jgi:hypothetical protein
VKTHWVESGDAYFQFFVIFFVSFQKLNQTPPVNHCSLPLLGKQDNREETEQSISEAAEN